MQISYSATRVKIWNLFFLSKNFIAQNFEVKKIRSQKRQLNVYTKYKEM